MHIFFTFLFFIIGAYSYLYSQNGVIEGTITNENNQPLIGCLIHIAKNSTTSTSTGKYVLKNIPKGKHTIRISHIGYQSIEQSITINKNYYFDFKLKRETNFLEEVVLHTVDRKTDISNKEIVNQKYIEDHFEGSLAKSLERLPGVNAMEIGVGTSKPIIRGLGFNRVAVAENGTKQEDQQWGVDHGLEIDALTVEHLEILKGVESIEYGSDAIGGVINIKNDNAPAENTFSGQWTTIGKSVNQGLTSSLSLQYRKKHFFYKLKNTMTAYGDYNIPTDQIIYLTRKIPIYNRRLKNTAGNELNWFGQLGYISEKFQSILTISNVYQKLGFFPGSHGIPDLESLKDDGNRRNIEYPFQKVNHFKLINKNEWSFDTATLTFLVGYQNNMRQEWSEFHTHFNAQTPSAINPNLEMEFNLDTYDAQLKYKKIFSDKHTTTMGFQGQWQENNIGGYSFLLPNYNRKNYGLFATHEYKYTDKTTYRLGVRLDVSQINIAQFFDPILYNFLIQNNHSEETANYYAKRSAAVSRNYTNFNIMAGGVYRIDEHWGFFFNTGTSFRLPTAIELAANGIHHGSFRHEQGDSDIDPEKGFVIDTKISYHKNAFNIGVSPYLYYFDNYIFLNPSGQFSILPDGGQLYKYTQTKAFLSGIELNVQNVFFDKLKIEVVFEYLYNSQISNDKKQNYPLPFTPPANGFIEIGYPLSEQNKTVRNTELIINSSINMTQNRIAQNEEITPGSIIFGTGIRSTIHLGKFTANINLLVSNLLNTRYYNHTSFYRAIELPQMGRNIQLMVRIPFNNSLND